MVMARSPFTVVCLAGLVLAGAAVAAVESNFSQYPGFAEYFAENPPAGVANAMEQALLNRHAPRFRGTRATGNGTAAAGSAATIRPSSPARRRRSSIAT